MILILGILSAVAAPKLAAVSGSATENSLKQTLAVVRDAIEWYAAENAGVMPGAGGTEAKFKSDLVPYLRGEFPWNPFKEKNTVDVQTSGAPLTSNGGPSGWRYDNRSGEFIANSNDGASDGVRRVWQL